MRRRRLGRWMGPLLAVVAVIGVAVAMASGSVDTEDWQWTIGPSVSSAR